MKFFNSLYQGVHPNLLIENSEDLENFIIYDSIIRSKQSVNFWFGFKSQKYYDNPLDYHTHQVESNNVMAIPLAFKMSLSDKVSLLDYCTLSDNIINDKYLSMRNIVLKGEKVKVNKFGGYCPFDADIFPYDEMKDVESIEQIANFILSGSLELKMEINSHSILIENGETIYDSTINDFSKAANVKGKEIQQFTIFKLKTILWKTENFANFFKIGLDNGLKNIMFQSTFEDMRQIDGLKLLLENLMSKIYSDKVLNIYIKTYSIKAKQSFKTNSNNIKIHFI